MQNKWPVVTLGELIEDKKAFLQTGPFGTALKAAEYSKTGVPLISVREVREGFFQVEDKTPRVDQHTIERLPKFVLNKGDIVFGRKGGVERNALVSSAEEGWFLGSDGIFLRLSDVEDAEFISYVLRSPATKAWLLQNCEGTTMPSLNQKILSRLPVFYPPSFEKRKIAQILKQFDKKISLNRQTNQTLENMAQALFKSWFVDFDPVIDNALAAGNSIPEALQKCAEQRRALREAASLDKQAPAPLPEAIRQLFPASFVFDAEMGWIPEGWEVGTFSKVANHVRANIKPENINDDDIYVGLEHIGKKQIFLSDHGAGAEVESNKSGLMENDLLFGKLRPYFHKVCLAPKDGVCSTDILVFRAKTSCYHSFMALTAYTESFVEYANLRSTGTRMPRASAKDLLAYQLVLPPENLAETFEKMIQPMWDKGFSVVFSNDKLAKLRDTLLPKLISGELRLSPEASEAQQQTEAAVA